MWRRGKVFQANGTASAKALGTFRWTLRPLCVVPVSCLCLTLTLGITGVVLCIQSSEFPRLPHLGYPSEWVSLVLMTPPPSIPTIQYSCKNPGFKDQAVLWSSFSHLLVCQTRAISNQREKNSKLVLITISGEEQEESSLFCPIYGRVAKGFFP